MEYIIVKNGHVYARATDDDYQDADVIEIRAEEIPEYPSEEADRGKYWDLDYVDEALAWVLKDRPLTVEERLENVEQLIN